MSQPPHLPERFEVVDVVTRLDGRDAWRCRDREKPGGEAIWSVCPWATLERLGAIEKELRRLDGWSHPGLLPRVGFVRPTHDHRAWVGFPACDDGELAPLDRIDALLRPLRMLHRRGVVHGRLSPDALCIVNGKQHLAELLPFGDRPEPRAEASWGYLAPETLRDGRADRRSDVYAIGALAFDWIFGTAPFVAKDDGADGLRERILSGRRRRPALPEGYPPALQEWIERALSVEPSDRFRDAESALKTWVELNDARYPLETEEDRLAEEAAERHASSIETGLSEERVANDRVSAIYEMIAELNSQRDADRVLESILDIALRVVQAERGMLLLRQDDGTFDVSLARNLEQETIDEAATFSRGVVSEAGDGRAVLSLDARQDERFANLESVSRFGIHAVMCVPLKTREAIVGVVYLDSKQEGVFTPDDLRFVESFANHAALALEQTQRRKEISQETARLQSEAERIHDASGLIGESAAMQAVHRLIDKVADSDLPVLIQGESGTGKELVARAIHFKSDRRAKSYVSENCAAIPDSLLQSELFGHVRGAFTGADRDRAGLFEQADGGTLFLDEIGDMSSSMQAQLLRTLQEGELRRVGGESTVNVDVRLLAATHRDLQREADAGRFRSDLLYRLQVLLIDLPPLREREGDVALLATFFLRQIAEQSGREMPRIEGALLEKLDRYDWPGNVRQLQNTIQRLFVLSGGEALDVDLLNLDPKLKKALESDAPAASGTLAQTERERIQEALRTAKGKKARAARLLGISRATLYRKLKEYELD